MPGRFDYTDDDFRRAFRGGPSFSSNEEMFDRPEDEGRGWLSNLRSRLQLAGEGEYEAALGDSRELPPPVDVPWLKPLGVVNNLMMTPLEALGAAFSPLTVKAPEWISGTKGARIGDIYTGVAGIRPELGGETLRRFLFHGAPPPVDKLKEAIEQERLDRELATSPEKQAELLQKRRVQAGFLPAVASAGVSLASDPMMIAPLGRAGKLLAPGIVAHGIEEPRRVLGKAWEEGLTPEVLQEIPGAATSALFAALVGKHTIYDRVAAKRRATREMEARAKAEAAAAEAIPEGVRPQDVEGLFPQRDIERMMPPDNPVPLEVAEALRPIFDNTLAEANRILKSGELAEGGGQRAVGYSPEGPQYADSGVQRIIFLQDQNVPGVGIVEGNAWTVGDTIFITRRGLNSVRQAGGDVASIKGRIIELLAHEATHPETERGMPAVRRTAMGRPVDPNMEPAGGHGIGAPFDDRLQDLSQLMLEHNLRTALRKSPAVHAAFEAVEPTRLQPIEEVGYAPTAGTYQAGPLALAADIRTFTNRPWRKALKLSPADYVSRRPDASRVAPPVWDLYRAAALGVEPPPPVQPAGAGGGALTWGRLGELIRGREKKTRDKAERAGVGHPAFRQAVAAEAAGTPPKRRMIDALLGRRRPTVSWSERRSERYAHLAKLGAPRVQAYLENREGARLLDPETGKPTQTRANFSATHPEGRQFYINMLGELEGLYRQLGGNIRAWRSLNIESGSLGRFVDNMRKIAAKLPPEDGAALQLRVNQLAGRLRVFGQSGRYDKGAKGRTLKARAAMEEHLIRRAKRAKGPTKWEKREAALGRGEETTAAAAGNAEALLSEFYRIARQGRRGQHTGGVESVEARLGRASKILDQLRNTEEFYKLSPEQRESIRNTTQGMIQDFRKAERIRQSEAYRQVLVEEAARKATREAPAEPTPAAAKAPKAPKAAPKAKAAAAVSTKMTPLQEAISARIKELKAQQEAGVAVAPAGPAEKFSKRPLQKKEEGKGASSWMKRLQAREFYQRFVRGREKMESELSRARRKRGKKQPHTFWSSGTAPGYKAYETSEAALKRWRAEGPPIKAQIQRNRAVRTGMASAEAFQRLLPKRKYTAAKRAILSRDRRLELVKDRIASRRAKATGPQLEALDALDRAAKLLATPEAPKAIIRPEIEALIEKGRGAEPELARRLDAMISGLEKQAAEKAPEFGGPKLEGVPEFEAKPRVSKPVASWRTKLKKFAKKKKEAWAANRVWDSVKQRFVPAPEPTKGKMPRKPYAGEYTETVVDEIIDPNTGKSEKITRTVVKTVPDFELHKTKGDGTWTEEARKAKAAQVAAEQAQIQEAMAKAEAVKWHPKVGLYTEKLDPKTGKMERVPVQGKVPVRLLPKEFPLAKYLKKIYGHITSPARLQNEIRQITNDLNAISSINRLLDGGVISTRKVSSLNLNAVKKLGASDHLARYIMSVYRGIITAQKVSKDGKLEPAIPYDKEVTVAGHRMLLRDYIFKKLLGTFRDHFISNLHIQDVRLLEKGKERWETHLSIFGGAPRRFRMGYEPTGFRGEGVGPRNPALNDIRVDFRINLLSRLLDQAIVRGKPYNKPLEADFVKGWIAAELEGARADRPFPFRRRTGPYPSRRMDRRAYVTWEDGQGTPTQEFLHKASDVAKRVAEDFNLDKWAEPLLRWVEGRDSTRPGQGFAGYSQVRVIKEFPEYVRERVKELNGIIDKAKDDLYLEVKQKRGDEALRQKLKETIEVAEAEIADLETASKMAKAVAEFYAEPKEGLKVEHRFVRAEDIGQEARYEYSSYQRTGGVPLTVQPFTERGEPVRLRVTPRKDTKGKSPEQYTSKELEARADFSRIRGRSGVRTAGVLSTPVLRGRRILPPGYHSGTAQTEYIKSLEGVERTRAYKKAEEAAVKAALEPFDHIDNLITQLGVDTDGKNNVARLHTREALWKRKLAEIRREDGPEAVKEYVKKYRTSEWRPELEMDPFMDFVHEALGQHEAEMPTGEYYFEPGKYRELKAETARLAKEDLRAEYSESEVEFVDWAAKKKESEAAAKEAKEGLPISDKAAEFLEKAKALGGKDKVAHHLPGITKWVDAHIATGDLPRSERGAIVDRLYRDLVNFQQATGRKPSAPLQKKGTGKGAASITPEAIKTLAGTVTPRSWARTLKEPSPSSIRRRQLVRRFGSAINVTRPFRTAVDVSAPFRNTWQLTTEQAVRDPITTATNVWDMLRTFASEQATKDLNEQLHNDTIFKLGRKAGVEFVTKSSKHEAFIGADLAERVLDHMGYVGKPLAWVIKSAERSFNYWVNRTMRDALLHGADFLSRREIKDPETGKLRKMTKEEYGAALRDVVDFINNAGGRGKIFRKSKFANEVASYAFFSARLNASRVRMLANAATGFAKLEPAAAAYARRHVLNSIIGGIAVNTMVGAMAAAMGLKPEVEINPDSSDWGKVKLGAIRFDGWGGVLQWLRLPWNVVRGKRKELTSGRTVKTSPTDTVGTFLRGKLAPAPGTIVDIITRRSMTGESMDIKELKTHPSSFALKVAKQLLLPMSIDDATSILAEDPKLWWLIPAMAMGAGVNAYRGGKEEWLGSQFEFWKPEVRAARKRETAIETELRKQGVRGPRLSHKVQLPGKDPYGRPKYYNLTPAEVRDFEKQYMPVISDLLWTFINTDAYQSLPADRKPRALTNYISKMNKLYSGSKRLKGEYRQKYLAGKIKESNIYGGQALEMEEAAERMKPVPEYGSGGKGEW